jgi:zinc transport system substrate-binding protein
MRFTRLSVLLASTVLFTSCAGPGNVFGNKKDADKRPVIAASFYPIAEIVQRVAGDEVQLLQLTPAGKEPHETDLSAQQLVELSKADVVFYLGSGFQPNVEKAIKSLPSSVKTIDLLQSVDVLPQGSDKENCLPACPNNNPPDPHVWLDPNNMSEMAITVAAEISKVPSLADTTPLTEGLTTYATELQKVGSLIDTTFKKCERGQVVTSHDAFMYFAVRAKLITMPITGVDPQVEPSAKDLEGTAFYTKEVGVTTVFYEKTLPREFADTLAKMIGAKVDSIDAVETISEKNLAAGANYISIMKSNITKIAVGLGCK